MVQVARLAPKLLESSTSLVVDFFHSQRREDGGFCDRDGRSDLYYTVFGIEGSLALQQSLPVDQLHHYVSALPDPQGAFHHSRELPVAHVPATAGAVTLLRHLGGQAIDPAVGEWFLSCLHPQGGFRPAPSAPVPDLLSTATALHALTSM